MCIVVVVIVDVVIDVGVVLAGGAISRRLARLSVKVFAVVLSIGRRYNWIPFALNHFYIHLDAVQFRSHRLS